MRSLAFLGLVLLTSTTTLAQPKKDPAPKHPAPKHQAPAKVVAQLKPWQERLKQSTEPEVKERPEGFVRVRNVATEVKAITTKSDFAEKPYVATIQWRSSTQESKIFSDKEKAAKTNDWLPPGNVAGETNLKTTGQIFTATLYYAEGMWVLQKIEWWADLPAGIKNAPPLAVASTVRGDKHPWYDAFKEIKGK